jgi:glycosyltransferase, group 2 family
MAAAARLDAALGQKKVRLGFGGCDGRLMGRERKQMEIAVNILQWISLIVLLIAAPMSLWQLIIAIRGLFPMMKKPVLEEKNHRFAVLICARNEAAVIGNLIDSLKEQEYPAEDFTVFVIADNCTDQTAEISRRHGAAVYERFDRTKVGKGFALHWAFERIREDYPDRYDAVAIFDADNLVAPDFLYKINEALCSGADVAQGYRDTKNVNDSSVSASYAIYWLMLMRFFHRARYNWGLSCLVGGTGFAFKMSCIPDGWNTKSLGEDSEFSMQQISAGRKIVPVYDAVFYDEQPTTWGMSIRQRFRWMVGCFQCLKYELPNDIKAFFKGRLAAFDVIMYMLSMVALALLTLSTLCSLVAFVIAPLPADADAFKWRIFQMIAPVAWSWISMSAVALFTLLLEHKPLKLYWKGILVYPVFIIPMAWLAFLALVHPKTEWKPITHTKNQSITDMAKPS